MLLSVLILRIGPPCQGQYRGQKCHYHREKVISSAILAEESLLQCVGNIFAIKEDIQFETIIFENLKDGFWEMESHL